MSERVQLTWCDNRKPGQPEWSADCGCAWHYFKTPEPGKTLWQDEVDPHWHQCDLHAGAKALEAEVAKLRSDNDIIDKWLECQSEVGRLREALVRITAHDDSRWLYEDGLPTIRQDTPQEIAAAALAPASEPCEHQPCSRGICLKCGVRSQQEGAQP